MLERIGQKAIMRSAVAEVRRKGKTVALVPTMGALHEGHLSMMRAACSRADVVVASVFVNPLQFGEGEDFSAYPRDLETDRDLLKAAGVDFLFAPTVDEMYGTGADTAVVPGVVASRWEGERRPGHFEGVATVVVKLLNVVRPDLAFFGEKDFQQLSVVRRLVEDLDLGVRVVPAPIVRDVDGLALSSRNVYLSRDERARALAIPRALDAARAAVEEGERDMVALVARSIVMLEEAGLDPDYVAVVDPHTLEPVDVLETDVRMLIAARSGSTRLIDNCALVAV